MNLICSFCIFYFIISTRSFLRLPNEPSKKFHFVGAFDRHLLFAHHYVENSFFFSFKIQSILTICREKEREKKKVFDILYWIFVFTLFDRQIWFAVIACKCHWNGHITAKMWLLFEIVSLNLKNKNYHNRLVKMSVKLYRQNETGADSQQIHLICCFYLSNWLYYKCVIGFIVVDVGINLVLVVR